MILFSKYHGCGNSFVIVKEKDLSLTTDESGYPEAAQKLCDMHIGVGADGMIVVREKPALEMVFYNCDGSRAPMCGNGIRCFAHFCREEEIRMENSYPVRTLAGEMIVDVTCEDPFMARINMGKPLFSEEAVGIESGESGGLDRILILDDGSEYEIHSLFMGTVHTVVFVDSFDDMDIAAIGEKICDHPTFRGKTNVNFVKIVDRETLRVKTYERGVGVTLACGTGACASVVSAYEQGVCGRDVEVLLELGSLHIHLDNEYNVYMEGPSVKIMSGEFC